MNPSDIKKALLQLCLAKVETQIIAIETSIASIIESRDNETKSSVGDKYETGRAMMQMEYQKAQLQLLQTQSTRDELKAINLDRSNQQVGKGNLVETDNGNYFIAVGMGKILFEDKLYYCISLASPIGKLLNSKTLKDTIEFNSKRIFINNIY